MKLTEADKTEFLLEMLEEAFEDATALGVALATRQNETRATEDFARSSEKVYNYLAVLRPKRKARSVA